MKKRRAILLLVPLLCALISAEQSAPPAKIKDGIFTSDKDPRIQIKIDRSLQYLGAFPFNIENIAGGYRYVFAQVGNDERVTRTFIIQMEGFFDSSKEVYRYPISNPVKLGGAAYQHNVFMDDNDENIREAPGHESELTKRFFESKRLQWGPQMVMSRFARPVGADKRHEIIFFYWEDLKDYEHSMKDFGDQPTPEYTRIKNAVDANSRKAFTVLERKN
jgi:hypothetical protein